MSNRYSLRPSTCKRCLLPLSLAAALGSLAPEPAMALQITSQKNLSDATDLNNLNDPEHEESRSTITGAPVHTRVQVGDGTNAFNQPAFAEAFSTIRNGQATYWISTNADSAVSLDNGGIGQAAVNLSYTAIKEGVDKALTLHVTGGRLELIDPEATLLPLTASVFLEALVSHGNDTLEDVVARADLSGHGGTFPSPHGGTSGDETFNLDTAGLNAILSLQDDGGNNVVGATVDIFPLDIPVPLENIVDGTPIDINISLVGRAVAPGGERAARVFFRDPAHADDPEPFAGAATITFDTVSPGGGTSGGTSISEPSSLAIIGPILLGGYAWLRRRRDGAGG